MRDGLIPNRDRTPSKLSQQRRPTLKHSRFSCVTIFFSSSETPQMAKDRWMWEGGGAEEAGGGSGTVILSQGAVRVLGRCNFYVGCP